MNGEWWINKDLTGVTHVPAGYRYAPQLGDYPFRGQRFETEHGALVALHGYLQAKIAGLEEKAEGVAARLVELGHWKPK